MRVSSRINEHSSRSGFSLLEMFVAGTILTVILSALGPTVYWLQRAQKASEQQQFAVLELANQMERVFSVDGSVTTESLKTLSLSSSASEILADAALTSRLTGSGIDRKLTLSLTWSDSTGQTVEPKQLVAWLPEIIEQPATETASVQAQNEDSL